MAVLKCKMCGGDLVIEPGLTVCTCEYCGTKQTVPTADNDKKINLFARANRFRMSNEFDKASGVYESIIEEFSEEAEAYWGLVLCKYGIEYVDDPATGNKIPTCHRSSFDSVMEDKDFQSVMDFSDPVSRKVYREQAKEIEEIRKGILEVSSKEEPYDIFICYKETDENGDRTNDSVIAQDVYTELTEKGYRVFFSRITLEDKLGVEYEPYIFAALHSAKVMLAFGTDYEYYNAVWVKNEWSRFLSLIAKGEKKTLIPCYKNIDAYDMPKEFAHLQAQDMGKVGAIQDLVRGIDKIFEKTAKVSTVAVAMENNVDKLLATAFDYIEKSDWERAEITLNSVITASPENAMAYLGKLLIANKLHKKEDLQNLSKPFDKDDNFKKIELFAEDGLKSELAGYIDLINKRNKEAADKIIAEQKAKTKKIAKILTPIVTAALAVVFIFGYALPQKKASDEFNRELFAIKNAKVGDIVIYGEYPQTETGGIEPIEWIICDKEENKRLLISKYMLDYRIYHDNSVIPRFWTKTDICAWLNNDFISKAFNDRELNKIFDSAIDDGYSKVFMLTRDEYKKYQLPDATATPYAYTVRYPVTSYDQVKNKATFMWFRAVDGSRDVYASGADNKHNANEKFYVRSAMWVDLS